MSGNRREPVVVPLAKARLIDLGAARLSRSTCRGAPLPDDKNPSDDLSPDNRVDINEALGFLFTRLWEANRLFIACL
jgi:hypothetical protein